MRSKILIAASAALLLIVLAMGVSMAEVNASSDIVLNVDVPGTNVIFMRVRAPQGNLDPYEVRAEIWKRLTEVLNHDKAINGSSVSVAYPEDGNPRILVKATVIVDVDAVHAAINGSSQEDLAKVWAEKLALALDRWAEINR